MKKLLTACLLMLAISPAFCWDWPWASGTDDGSATPWQKWNWGFVKAYYDCASYSSESTKLEKLVKTAPASNSQEDLTLFYFHLVDGMTSAYTQNGGQKPFILKYLRTYQKARPAFTGHSAELFKEWLHNLSVCNYVYLNAKDDGERNRSKEIAQFLIDVMPVTDSSDYSLWKQEKEYFIKIHCENASAEEMKYINQIFEQIKP